MKIQVEKKHYFGKNYMTKERWLNYYHQINNTLSLSPRKVLVIGIGDGVTPEYLEKCGIKTITLDLDPKLKPDIIGDVKKLPIKIKKQKFDLIICAHVLEHLPFKYFGPIIRDFSKISKYVILQLPPSVLQFRFNLALQPYFFNWNFNINLPLLFWKKYNFNGQHYWQPYRRNYSMYKIKKIIKKYFTIKKSYQCPENHYSYNFILESNLIKNV